jgi:hypothetical protein
MFTDIRNLWFEKMGRELRNFSIELSDFLYGLQNHPPQKWHERFDAFAANQRFQGRYMTPESEEALLAYISRRAAMETVENAGEEPVDELDPNAFALTEADKAKAREGLPWWYAKPFELGDGWWQEKFEQLAKVAGDKMLATCRELQILGSLARNVDQLPDDGIDVLQQHIDRVHAAHDDYIQALIDIDRWYLSYVKSHVWVGWLVARQIEKLAGKLPPRLFDLPSPKLQTLARARAELDHALGKVVKRVDTAYTVAVWTDRAITVLEFATGVAGAVKVAAKKAIAAGAKLTIQAAIKAGIKQAAIQGTVLVATAYGLPPLLQETGLNPDFVFAGVVVLQGLTAFQGMKSLRNDKNLDASAVKKTEAKVAEAKTRTEVDRSPDADLDHTLKPNRNSDADGPQYLEPLGPGIGRSNYQTLADFCDAVFRQYQRFYDEAYDIVTRQVALGLVANNRTVMGREIDQVARVRLRDWLVGAEGLVERPDGLIAVNRRLYDPSGTGRYRQPDVYIPGARIVFDGSIQRKTRSMAQSVEFHTFSGNGNVIIVRPTREGGSYGFFFR